MTKFNTWLLFKAVY